MVTVVCRKVISDVFLLFNGYCLVSIPIITMFKLLDQLCLPLLK